MAIEKCPQCGAELPEGEDCRARFDLCLAKEFADPAIFGAVHNLSVPAYMLQHNEYSREGWLETRKLLAKFVYEGLSPSDARKQNRERVDSGKLKWSFTKGEKLTQVDDIRWTRTLADVRLDPAEHYCADVKLWAASILADAESLMRELES
ncbi:MAG: hypothetical protein HZB51_09280 [Chloroflexi bacterium]|nr:hypothetical protein [Chloroflexota bacterium]